MISPSPVAEFTPIQRLSMVMRYLERKSREANQLRGAARIQEQQEIAAMIKHLEVAAKALGDAA